MKFCLPNAYDLSAETRQSDPTAIESSPPATLASPSLADCMSRAPDPLVFPA